MKRFARIFTLLVAGTLLIGSFAGCGSSSKGTAEDKAPAESSSPAAPNNASTPPASKTAPVLSENVAPVGTASQVVEAISPLKLSYKVHSETIKDDDGSDLVYLKITNPIIDNPKKHDGIKAINEYYDSQSDRFVATALSEGKAAAMEGKKSAKEGGYDFYPFAFEREPKIYYNANNLFSVLHTGYENTGGAHPNSYWASETFDVTTGKKLSLADIFGLSREKALEKVYDIVLAQIEKTKGTNDFVYFDSYMEDVKKYYSEENFVLDSDGILFYYQPYAIAPYAAGIPSFKLPYEKAGNLAISIPAVKSNDLERELYNQAGRLIEANKEVFYRIFGLTMLDLEVPENKPENQWVFPVKDKRFTTYSDLDGYIRGIYVKSEADSLMGNGRYINKDGKLYGDMSKDAGVGYYVDWNDYRYEISDISDTSATITIYTIDDSPAGKQDITIKVRMLKENGLWLLEKMIS